MHAESEMVDIVESVFSQIKLSAAVAEDGMDRRYGILMISTGRSFTNAIGSTKMVARPVIHHIWQKMKLKQCFLRH